MPDDERRAKMVPVASRCDHPTGCRRAASYLVSDTEGFVVGPRCGPHAVALVDELNHEGDGG